MERLGWLDDLGVEGVVLSNPYLIAFAHKRFPRLRIAVSTATAIDSVDKAQFFAGQGASVLYLPEYVNRDFPLLTQIRKRVHADIVLLSNVGCLLHCPIRQYHINLVSHSNESHELGTYVDYPSMWCSKEKARDAGQMLKAPWIRPVEDLAVYEEIGIEQFRSWRASGEMDRPWVERVTCAYAERRYDARRPERSHPWVSIIVEPLWQNFRFGFPIARSTAFWNFSRKNTTAESDVAIAATATTSPRR